MPHDEHDGPGQFGLLLQPQCQLHWPEAGDKGAEEAVPGAAAGVWSPSKQHIVDSEAGFYQSEKVLSRGCHGLQGGVGDVKLNLARSLGTGATSGGRGWAFRGEPRPHQLFPIMISAGVRFIMFRFISWSEEGSDMKVTKKWCL